MAVPARWLVGLWISVGVSITAAHAASSGDVPVTTGPALEIQPPLPVWPSDEETIVDRRPVFRINGRFQASRYRVELAKSPDFSEPVEIHDAEVASNDGIAPVVLAPFKGEPLEDGRCYWRAFAGDDTGFWTPPANYRTFLVSGKDTDAVIPPPGTMHPRLLIGTNDLAALHRKIARSEHCQMGWDYLQNAANSLLETAPPDEAYARSGQGQHAYYSAAANWYHQHLTNVAFVAAVTGDPKLAAAGVEMLMAACAFERWLGPQFDDPAHFDPPWHSALETAMMTTAVATAYDLLHPYLSDEQRATVREAIAEKGVRPLVNEWADPIGSSRLPRHQVPTGNWVMVCSSSAGVGALAMLGEHPEAAQWARLVRNRVRAWLHDRGGDYYVDNPWGRGRPTPIPVIGPSEPNFGVDGGYKESISYMNYAMVYVCCFADALRRTTKENLFEHVPAGILDHVAWSTLAWRVDGNVHSSLIDFNDCWASAAYPLLYAALTRHQGDARAAWLYPRITPVPQDPRVLAWYDDSVLSAPPDRAIPMAVFRGIGQVVMRSGWSPEAPAAAIKFHQNRGHLDIGTFYLFGGGHPTIVDSGAASYGSAIYNDYASQSIGHNLVLVDDRPQTRANGTLLSAIGTSRVTAASGQLAAAYPDALASWTRDLVMLPGGVALVLDRLAGLGAHRYDLVLHPHWPFQMPHSVASPGELLIGAEPATHVNVYSDQHFTAVEADGYHASLPRKYVRFNNDQSAEAGAFLAVCRWPGRDGRSWTPVDVVPTGPGRWRVLMVSGSSRLVVQTGSGATAGDVANARMVAVWDDGSGGRERHVLLLSGRRVNIEGRELLQADAPLDAAIEYGLTLRAHFWTSQPTHVAIAVGEDAKYAFLDGRPVDVGRQPGGVSIDLPAGESRLAISAVDRLVPLLPSLMSDDLLTVAVPKDAPAYRPGVLALASSCAGEGLRAIDGNVNTAWSSMPGLALPHWLEVRLDVPARIGHVNLGIGIPSHGRLELRDVATQAWIPRGEFVTTLDEPSARLSFEPVEADRLRALIERTDPDGRPATIHTLEWRD